MTSATALPQLSRVLAPQLLDFSFDEPARNLACDEALLDECENGGAEVLRFWESPRYFVTLGYTNSHREEADENFCAENNIPMLRRCSGGGTVLQGAGCLNYALVLRIESAPQFSQLDMTNAFIMARVLAALQPLCRAQLSVAGITDLAISQNGIARKFSGNAQRRRRNALLFHGTLLLDFNLHLLARALKPPPKQPHYRENRAHENFVTNVSMAREDAKTALRRAWNVTRVLAEAPHERIEKLVGEKYAKDEWNLKF
jgi:lipoate-protein ligase A